ncbi:MAG: hypothetical protein JRI25_11145, partial [Deltaproteobacteria bacterium]|nr:hypothetical protein [Deltaproteobacteria bacterium]
MRPGTSLVAALLGTMAPFVAGAQDDSTETWSLESGEAQVVEVGPHRNYVVLDPDRIRVETLGPGVLSVTALHTEGPAVMYVFTERGPRTLVFWVRERATVQGIHEPTATWDARPRNQPKANFVYSALGALSGTATGVRASTVHELELAQGFADTELDGHLTVAGQEGVGWHVPYVGLRARRGDLSLALGDEHLTLATGVASLPVRGASLTWSREPARTFAGAVVGAARPTSCCAFIDPDEPIVAVLRGGHGGPTGPRVRAAAGILRDPDIDHLLPLLRLGLAHRDARSDFFAELFHLGAGSGASADLRLSVGRLDLASNARLTTQGLVLGRDAVLSSNVVQARITPTVRLTDRWAAVASASFSHAFHPQDPALLYSGGELGARYRAGSSFAVQGTYRLLGAWERDEAWTSTTSTHVGEVISSHSTPRGHQFHNLLRLNFRGRDGFNGVFGAHRAFFQAGGAWSAGVTAVGSVSGVDGTVHTHLAGEVVHDVQRLYLRGQLGSVAVFGGPDGLAAGPMASGEVGWYPVANHRLGLDGNTSYATFTKASVWRVYARYTFTSGLVQRPDARAIGISGSIKGVVFEDLDADATRDPGEPGIVGFPVKLDGGRVAVTDESGAFRFRAVVPGAHEVSIDRGDWRTVGGTRHTVEVAPLRAATASFALNTGGRILARVFVDRDENGTFSNGDRGLTVHRLWVVNASGMGISDG